MGLISLGAGSGGRTRTDLPSFTAAPHERRPSDALFDLSPTPFPKSFRHHFQSIAVGPFKFIIVRRWSIHSIVVGLIKWLIQIKLKYPPRNPLFSRLFLKIFNMVNEIKLQDRDHIGNMFIFFSHAQSNARDLWISLSGVAGRTIDDCTVSRIRCPSLGNGAQNV